MAEQDIEALARGDELLKVKVESWSSGWWPSGARLVAAANGRELTGDVVLSMDSEGNRWAELHADGDSFEVEWLGHEFVLAPPVENLLGGVES